MPNFTIDEIATMMYKPDNIRNLSVIAHVDHGKSTLTDSLIAAAGIIAEKKAGDTRFMDTREDEQDRTITIKSTGVTLFFKMEVDEFCVTAAKTEIRNEELAKIAALEKAEEGKKKKKKKKKKKEKLSKEEEAKKEAEEAEAKKKLVAERVTKIRANILTQKDKKGNVQVPFLINLIDSPGHVDFSSEVTAALRVTDGALVVVDCVEGVSVQTETVLRQAIAERIKPVLWVNKLDRMFLEMQAEPEEMYQNFSRAIESVNVIIATYMDDLMGNVQVYPEDGSVGFGSGLHGWGFTLDSFAGMYAAKFKVSKEKMMTRLWGDQYINMKNGKWKKKRASNDFKRGFCALILSPIKTLCSSIMKKEVDKYTKILGKLNVVVPKDAKDLMEKPLLKRVMQTWLPAHTALLNMICHHLPSPVVAQKYRVENLYSGPMDDDSAKAIAACDKDGPLMMYVSKMVPTSEAGRFYAFGRVFSGVIKTGQQVRIMGPDYKPGSKTDLFLKKIQRCVLMMGRYTEQISECPCGNTIGLVGVDQYLIKSGTIATAKDAHGFIQMKYSVAPVVRVAVECKNASDLPKLMEGLKRLSKADPLVLIYTANTGEHIVAGCGELHLQVCLKDLEEDLMKNVPIKKGNPVVSFCETVSIDTDIDCIGKSANKHNRIYLRGCPLGKEFEDIFKEGLVNVSQDVKERTKVLVNASKDWDSKYSWDKESCRKIWSFGCPPEAECNVLVDMTKGVQYLNEIKDSMKSAFIQATAEGILCGEAMRGCRFEIHDVVMHADSIHRGAGQIMPPAKRAMYGVQLRSGPKLYEPYFQADITVPNTFAAGVYKTLNARRGEVVAEETTPGTPLCKIKAYVPVLESFGFTQFLRQNTSGRAFPQLIFSHWDLVAGDVFTADKKGVAIPAESSVTKIMLDVRKRKGMKEEIPMFGDYYDRV